MRKVEHSFSWHSKKKPTEFLIEWMQLVMKYIYWAVFNQLYAEIEEQQLLIVKFEVKNNCTAISYLPGFYY